MALDTVADYVSEARVLLQDQVVPYRYADNELVTGLNLAFLEGRRLRPDLFIVNAIPSFTDADSTTVKLDEQYRVAFLYYVCGNAQMRDEENTQDARSADFMQKFTAKLLSLAA